jgi:hypothetical protein
MSFMLRPPCCYVRNRGPNVDRRRTLYFLPYFPFNRDVAIQVWQFYVCWYYSLPWRDSTSGVSLVSTTSVTLTAVYRAKYLDTRPLLQPWSIHLFTAHTLWPHTCCDVGLTLLLGVICHCFFGISAPADPPSIMSSPNQFVTLSEQRSG